jgi:drug/metabolite transporter (DMT)-like permease
MKTALKEVLSVSGMVLSWATYFAVSKWAIGMTGSPFAAGLLLRFAAFLYLTIYLVAKKQFSGLFCLGKAALILLFIGFLGYALDAFANFGFQKSSVATGTALLKTDILMANIASAVLMKEKLRATDWTGTALMLCGVLLVLDIDYRNFSFGWYDVFFLLSALAVTANAFVITSAQKKYAIASEHIAYYNNFVVMCLFLLSALIGGNTGLSAVAANGPTAVLLIALGGLAQTCIYIFYYRNLKKYPVWQVKLFLLFVPVVSCLAGVILFQEVLSFLQYAGIVLLLAGGAVILLRRRIYKTNI